MNLFARKLIFHIILPLVAGLAIYILFRKNTWLHQHLVPAGFSPFILPHNWLNDFLVFNMPDFCWSYSMASSLFYWKRLDKVRINYFPALVFLIIIAAESIQYFLSSSFTFDWLDMAATIAAFLLSYVVNGRHEKT